MINQVYAVEESHIIKLKELSEQYPKLSRGAIVRTALDRLFKEIDSKRLSPNKILDGRRKIEDSSIASVTPPTKTPTKKVNKPKKSKAKVAEG